MNETDDHLDKLHTAWIADWRTQVELIDKKRRVFDSEAERDKARKQYLDWITYSVGFLNRQKHR